MAITVPAADAGVVARTSSPPRPRALRALVRGPGELARATTVNRWVHSLTRSRLDRSAGCTDQKPSTNCYLCLRTNSLPMSPAARTSDFRLETSQLPHDLFERRQPRLQFRT